MRAGILMHDMQTTQDYGLILHTNLEFDPQARCHHYTHMTYSSACCRAAINHTGLQPQHGAADTGFVCAGHGAEEEHAVQLQ